jgi:hypothetical protein
LHWLVRYLQLSTPVSNRHSIAIDPDPIKFGPAKLNILNVSANLFRWPPGQKLFQLQDADPILGVKSRLLRPDGLSHCPLAFVPLFQGLYPFDLRHQFLSGDLTTIASIVDESGRVTLWRIDPASVGHDGYEISEIARIANRGVDAPIGKHSNHDQKSCRRGCGLGRRL